MIEPKIRILAQFRPDQAILQVIPHKKKSWGGNNIMKRILHARYSKPWTICGVWVLLAGEYGNSSGVVYYIYIILLTTYMLIF